MGALKLIFVFLLGVNSSFGFWAEPEAFDPHVLAQDAPPEASPEVSTLALRDPKPYLWLYKLIMPTEAQQVFPARTQKSFKVHLQDTYSVFVHPDEIQQRNLWQPLNSLQNTFRTLTGKITYVGFFQKTYRYDVINLTSGSRVMRIKLHFKNASAQDLAQLKTKLAEAEAIWMAARWPRDFNYGFKFQIVNSAKEAHYSLQLKDKTRGPYDTYWSRQWSARTIAHEVGHMFGLGDEYQTLTGQLDCLVSSLMCSSQGELLPHNYYFILRRLLKTN